MPTKTLFAGLFVIAAAAALVVLTVPDRGSRPTPAHQSTGQSLSRTQMAEVERIVEAYILQNPDIIPRAIQQLQARQRADEQRDLTAQVEQNWDSIVDDPVAPRAGPADAPVTIVEYYDYRCPYCRRAFGYMRDLMAERDDVQYIYKQFPILDRPGDSEAVSREAALYALAAERQNRFKAFHAAAMTADGDLTVDRLAQLAEAAGLDAAQLAEDRADPDLKAYVQTILKRAQQMGLTATPTFLVNGQVIQGAVGKDRMVRAIEAAKAEG